MGAPTSASVYRTNDTVRGDFSVFDSAGAAVTGLVDANFTKVLTRNGATSAQTVTVTEIASGLYTATFTANATGDWSLSVRHATHNPEGWEGSWTVFSSDLDDIGYIAVTAAPASPTADTMLDLLRFIEEFAGEGLRLDWTYDGSNRVSSVALTYSPDGFTTTHRSRTISYTYGDAANPLRPTRIQWAP